MVAKAYVALEIIWFGAIIGVIIAYPILQTFLTARRREIQAATLLVVSLAIFVAGFIAWMFFGNWLCENLTKYTGIKFSCVISDSKQEERKLFGSAP